MPRDNSTHGAGRRTLLKSLGALGAMSAVGTTGAAAADDESGSLGDYRQTLRETLTASSRQQRQLPAGTYVYGDTEQAALDAFSLRGGGSATSISVETDAVAITAGERLAVPEADDPGAVSYRGVVPDPSLSTGDRLLAVAYVRSDDEDAELTAAFGALDDSGALDENAVQRGSQVDPTGEWMRYFFPIEVGSAEASGSVAFELQAGHTDQTVDVGGLALIKYGADEVSLGTLPPYDYDGRAEDADWRDAARERIEKHRKADLDVTVLNPGGQPMQGASVDVQMVEHEFDFGSAVSATHVLGDGEDDEKYREVFLENFNKATPENALKYPAWEGDWGSNGKSDALDTLAWLADHDIPARGHYLLWEQLGGAGGGGMSVPTDLSTSELESRITEKIREHANTLSEHVTEWDMHNHPIWQSNLRDMDALGWDAVSHWWDVANQATDDELYTNEMGVFGGTWQRSQYYDYITHLVENDYPLDGIGFMAHHQQQWNQMLDVPEILSGFDQFAEFGVPLLITEFDIQIFDRRNAQDVAVQRDYLRDFMTAAFSKEAVEGIVSWGFWAEDHWRPSGAYYDADWTPRPHGEQFRDLVFDEWWTEESGETDRDGRYTTRGFKGEYEITAEKGDLSGTATVTLDEDTDTVTVRLTPPGKRDNGSEDDEDAEQED